MRFDWCDATRWCFPLPPQTGSSIICGPQTHDGLIFEDQDPEESDKSLRLIKQHIADMSALDCSGNDLPPPEYLAKIGTKICCGTVQLVSEQPTQFHDTRTAPVSFSHGPNW